MRVSKEAVQKGRAPCPKCQRKGLGYANHPHAFGWKDYGRTRCRYCKAVFKIKD
jgi:uncharacterized Zn-finger protein